jgi:hypothetical protein
MSRRLVIVGLAILLAGPALVIPPASAAVVFTCDSVTGSATVSPGLVHDGRDQVVQSGPTALAGPADISLVSTSENGVKADAASTVLALSADGTKMAFSSAATNLHPQAPNGGVFVKDLNTGALTLVPEASASGSASLSADGTELAFSTLATNLDPRDTDEYADIYVKDLITGQLTLASVNAAGVKGNRSSFSPSLSAHGKKVAFGSRSTTLNPGDGGLDPDAYVKNLVTGRLRLVSTNDADSKGNEGSGPPVLSADARRVAFSSNSTNFDPRVTSISIDHVYVKNLSTGDLTLVSTNDADVKGNHVSDFSLSFSGDGARLSFGSWASNLDQGDPDGVTDVYVKDLTTGDITLASTSDTGVKGNGQSGAVNLSADGTRIMFTSHSTNLDPADTEVRSDVYVKDLTTGSLTLVSTSDAGVKGNGLTSSALMIADGTRVVFGSTSTSLDPADTDAEVDLYLKHLPATSASVELAGCSNGQTGSVSIAAIESFSTRPLGCPQALGGAAGNDYPDRTPILVGANPSFAIDWASGPDSHGVASVQAGPTGTQWRVRLTITASPGHDTPATNQYFPEPGSGFTKSKLKGTVDVGALDGFRCGGGIGDPLSWVEVINNGSWVALSR